MGVEKGDLIKVEPETKWVLQKVEWRQKFKSNEDEYYFANFENTKTGATEKESVLFIQKSKAGDFKNLAQKDGDEFTVTVTDAFRYGQKKGGSNRFLVYHDTSRDIFQHRFIRGMINQIGDTATEVVNKLGYTDVNSISGALEGSFGDSLKKY